MATGDVSVLCLTEIFTLLRLFLSSASESHLYDMNFKYQVPQQEPP